MPRHSKSSDRVPSYRDAGGRKIRAIVFDLDGTLIDSVPDIHLALNRILVEAGRPAVELDAVKLMIGDGAKNLVASGFAVTGKILDVAELETHYRRFLRLYDGADAATLTRPYPGVVETLECLEADGYRLGICTNKPAGPTAVVLARLDLGKFFEAVVTPEGAPAQKPDPAHLKAVLDRLGAAESEAVMVGDSANDVTVARRAGMPVVAVSYGYPRMAPEALGADLLIDEMTALPDALARLG